MLTVALVGGAATAFGVLLERRTPRAQQIARAILALILYALTPFYSFVNFAHLHLSAAGGVGIVCAYVALALSGVAAWFVGRRLLALASPGVGALICCAILANTGYLGLPLALTVLGSGPLRSAIAYDQLVSGPMFLIVGFAIGAIFGTAAGDSARARVRAYLARNPPLLAVILGLLTPASLVPHVLVSASHGVVLGLLPLGFIVVGVSLAGEQRLIGARLLAPPDRAASAAIVLRLALTPLLLTLVSSAVIHLPRAYALQAAMPSAVNSLIIGHAYGLDQRLIVTAIAWSTVTVLVVGLILSVA